MQNIIQTRQSDIRVSTLRERVDDTMLDYKQTHDGKIAPAIMIPESMIPDEYRGKKTLNYDGVEIPIIIMLGV